MTNEEIAHQHKEECNRCRENFEAVPNCSKCENTVIIRALEKQIPKKPNIDGHMYVAFHKFATGTCPKCRRKINENADDFCSGCGQAIDWGDYDDE